MVRAPVLVWKNRGTWSSFADCCLLQLVAILKWCNCRWNPPWGIPWTLSPWSANLRIGGCCKQLCTWPLYRRQGEDWRNHGPCSKTGKIRLWQKELTHETRTSFWTRPLILLCSGVLMPLGIKVQYMAHVSFHSFEHGPLSRTWEVNILRLLDDLVCHVLGNAPPWWITA